MPPFFSMKHQDIVDAVLTKLNEHGYKDDVSLITGDSLTLTDYIEAAIRDAVIQLNRVNVKQMPCVFASGDTIELAEDFVSMLEMSCSEWKKVVTEVTEPGTPQYVMAQNKYTEPGVNNPVVLRMGTRTFKVIPTSSDLKITYNAAYDTAVGIAGESESRMVVDAATQIVLNIFNKQ